MEIKRKIEMLVATNEVFVIRKASMHKPTACPTCGKPMLPAEQTVKMFGITQRRIFQLVEAGATHFLETDAGATMICLTSMAIVLEADTKK